MIKRKLNRKLKRKLKRNKMVILSGEPKDGNVIEKINIWKFSWLMLLSIFLGIIAVIFNLLILVPVATLFAWQAGWGMSIERFKIFEETKKELK